MPTKLQISVVKNEKGQPAVVVDSHAVDILPIYDLLKMLKQQCPKIYENVYLEIDVPQPGTVNRILNAEGRPNGDG